jgi:predicted ABC-type ATPase
MNVDRLPDGGDDDRERATETPPLTEPAPPEAPPPPEPSPPKADLPATEEPQSTENAVQADDSPEASDTAAPPPDPAEARETAEPRSRQEHADQPPPPDAAPRPAEQVHGTNQEEAPPAKATPAETEDSVASDIPASPHDHSPAESEDSNVQGEPPGETGAKSDEDTEYGEVPPQETPPEESPDPQPAQESTPREESDQKDIDDAGHSRGDEHVDKAPDQEALPDERRTSSTDSPDQKVPKHDDDPTLADERVGTLAEEWTEHLVEVREGLDSGRREGLISKRLHTIDGAGEIWTEERDRLHDSIIEDLYAKAAHVPSDFKAIIAGGLGGAGKTTVLTQYAGIDLSHYLMINPDGMKEEMARRGMIPEIDGLSPMEASELVHEESSYLASQLALRAQADGKNVIWDITMSSEESVAKRINELAAAGYTHIEGVFVDIPVEISLQRIESRHREGHDRYLAGHGLGGRYVPPEVIESQKDQELGSKNMRTFATIKQRFSAWSIYDNSGRRPALVEASGKRSVNS